MASTQSQSSRTVPPPSGVELSYQILGELKVVGANGILETTARRQRVVLAMLLLDANHVVPVDRLVDAVWIEAPPATARAQIHTCVGALRRALAAVGITDAIVTRPGGYLIRADDGQLDLHAFERLAQAGRVAAAERRTVEAADLYDEALAYWRGQPLADIDSRVVHAAALKLVERRLALTEENVDIKFELGRHHELIGELMVLATDNPVREGLLTRLMTALYRDGRRAEALEVYRRARRAFVRELGLEPGRAMQQLERAILTGGSDLDAGTDGTESPPEMVSEPVSPPRMLPADIPDFTGHEKLVGHVREVLATARLSQTAPGIVAIGGMGGVGKTTLAVHLAHLLSNKFPDGQLYLTLRGSEGHPVDPAQALERFLRGLGVPGSVVPGTLDERAELYRSRLATQQVLVVLDDVANEDQVIPLLPGRGPSAVLVTSRRRLTWLPGAHYADLDVLEPAQAIELVANVTGVERVGAEPDAALSLVRLCGQLPFALRIVAARLAAKPHWTVERLVSHLQDERRRLDVLEHGGVGIRESIATAYGWLDCSAKRLFRRLGMLESGDFDAWVTVPLLDVEPAEAEEALETLVDVRLVTAERVGKAATRYSLHELIRVYARERLAAEDSTEDRRDALRRVMGAWLYLAREAHRVEYGGNHKALPNTVGRSRLPDWVVSQVLSDPITWYERERQVLVHVVRQVAETGLNGLCWNLAMRMLTFFEVRSNLRNWVRLDD